MARHATSTITATLLAAMAWSPRAQVSSVAADEEVVLFPTHAYRTQGGGWRVRVRGWVFEPEANSGVRREILARAVAALAVKDEEAALFRARLRPFLVDNERRERVVVAVGETRAPMPASGPDGHFEGDLELDDTHPASLLQAGDGGGVLTLRVILPAGDEREFTGRAHALAMPGTSVVSDIDDTVRLASGADVRARVRDALIGDYEAVPEMARAYRALAARGAAFHWLTAAPWQLHDAYDEFLRRAGFPAGPLHMRKFRLHDRSVLDLLRGPGGHKEQVLEALLADFPARHFVLIGDTVEDDPEVFGAVARRHPGQVANVLLRQVGDADEARLQRAFADCPPALWRVFRTGEELQQLIEEMPPPAPHEQRVWR